MSDYGNERCMTRQDLDTLRRELKAEIAEALREAVTNPRHMGRPTWLTVADLLSPKPEPVELPTMEDWIVFSNAGGVSKSLPDNTAKHRTHGDYDRINIVGGVDSKHSIALKRLAEAIISGKAEIVVKDEKP